MRELKSEMSHIQIDVHISQTMRIACGEPSRRGFHCLQMGVYLEDVLIFV